MDHHTENDRLTGYKFSSINVCEGFSIYTDQTELLTKNYGENSELVRSHCWAGQIRRRKWNWLGHTLRRNDDSITKQTLQWTPQGHRGRGRPRNTWKRDLEKEMWTAGYKYSWRKMEAACGATYKCFWHWHWKQMPPRYTIPTNYTVVSAEREDMKLFTTNVIDIVKVCQVKITSILIYPVLRLKSKERHFWRIFIHLAI